MKIVGNTVGMGLPKPDLRQTNAKKGDYIYGKSEFLAQIKGVIEEYLMENPIEVPEDGVSPVVNVDPSEGGYRITITDANGEKTFYVTNGSDGRDGVDGSDGNGIKSAVLNADYTLTLTFDNGTSYTTPSIRGGTGSPGKDGSNGEDGTSVTVKSVSESSADGGSNVITFSDGKTLTVKNGKAGTNGKDGKTPEKFVDYFTGADQEAIVQQVIAALPVYNGEVV